MGTVCPGYPKGCHFSTDACIVDLHRMFGIKRNVACVGWLLSSTGKPFVLSYWYSSRHPAHTHGPLLLPKGYGTAVQDTFFCSVVRHRKTGPDWISYLERVCCTLGSNYHAGILFSCPYVSP